jgi:hypothetical protein
MKHIQELEFVMLRLWLCLMVGGLIIIVQSLHNDDAYTMQPLHDDESCDDESCDDESCDDVSHGTIILNACDHCMGVNHAMAKIVYTCMDECMNYGDGDDVWSDMQPITKYLDAMFNMLPCDDDWIGLWHSNNGPCNHWMMNITLASNGCIQHG